ncbi:methyltransferase domain-containing protein [Nocardioides immobilis]|uniref:site-specific DNA-methyltransferase (adenine-specific) n=1 Tax=Nocardioides immobilis TaxID=2049295 RepID=A0A417Y0J8_9ACTN|nr:N-6 DNA methylase [Nocardioides immobilis]RHW26126.1 methyltransferase domain-containing protein [Nocardioides immobilis]
MEERERVEALATAYEDRLVGELSDERRSRGAFYTPPELVDWILDRALVPGTSTVLDPACGTGHFLVAAARRVGVRAVHGSDLDPEAVRIARLRLQAEDPSVPAEEIQARVRVADGLTAWDGVGFDAVVGNPPFLGQLKRRTAGQRGGLGAYTDTSAAFLHRSLGLAAPGGTVALVQPLSVLGARDAGPVRAAAAAAGAVTDLWVSARPVFRGTSVLACVPVVRIGSDGGPGPDDWGRLAAPYFGIPAFALPAGTGVLGDLASCTADFRDQYYGLVPHVRDGGAGSPLITSGLIEPGRSEWGRRPTRFAKQQYDAPVVDVDGLAAADARLGAWAESRLVPKVLVAGQGRVIEAVVDERGEWLPSVPVVTVVPHDPADLWRVLAVLLAPPVVADAAARYLGTGLTPGSVKVSARQLAGLPLPADQEAWAAGAELARRAQHASDADRPALLSAVGEAMTAAYGAGPASLDWWRARIGRRADESPRRSGSTSP